MRTALVILLLLSLAYLATGLVYDEGGFGVRLVVKPVLTPAIMFGGGEDGWWQRSHPGAPPPWWLQEGLSVVVAGDWEEGVPLWVNAYLLGVAGVALAWPLWLLAFVVRVLWRRRGRQAPSPRVRREFMGRP